MHRENMITNKSFVNLIFLTFYIQFSWSASVYTNLNLPATNIESLCSQQTETHITSEGKESSLTLDLHPGLMTHGFCKRVLIAPESHGFFVRLAQTKGGKMQSSSSSAKNLRGMGSKASNSTNSCPLSILASTEQGTIPWRIDPCQLEPFGEEQVKLLPGRLRIVWDHGGNVPDSKLIVTAIGKGYPCQKRNKFPCLRFGSETILCISKDLICDGIRHCPKGTSYDSDEDMEICSRHRNGGLDNEFWDKLTFELFRTFFTTELPTLSTKATNLPAKSPDRIFEKTMKNIQEGDIEGQMKRNVTRSSVAGDLSKYGPWGYLMLGMLLCGGALLICGLWECCCRQNKSGDTNITGSTLPANNTDGEVLTPATATPDTRPPNYEELDPPPSYSALFPNQKDLSDTDIGPNNTNIDTSPTSSS